MTLFFSLSLSLSLSLSVSVCTFAAAMRTRYFVRLDYLLLSSLAFHLSFTSLFASSYTRSCRLCYRSSSSSLLVLVLTSLSLPLTVTFFSIPWKSQLRAKSVTGYSTGLARAPLINETFALLLRLLFFLLSSYSPYTQ